MVEDELVQAMSELEFGIKSYKISGSVVEIEALEGKINQLELHQIGFRDLHTGKFYDSLDSFLFEISPAFMDQFNKMVSSKLQQLQDEQECSTSNE
jgi:hypothetical protein